VGRARLPACTPEISPNTRPTQPHAPPTPASAQPLPARRPLPPLVCTYAHVAPRALRGARKARPAVGCRGGLCARRGLLLLTPPPAGRARRAHAPPRYRTPHEPSPMWLSAFYEGAGGGGWWWRLVWGVRRPLPLWVCFWAHNPTPAPLAPHAPHACCRGGISPPGTPSTHLACARVARCGVWRARGPCVVA
jgi:hypothetical protein